MNPYERTIAMFGNRAVSVQLVKQPKAGKDATTETVTADVDWDKIGKIAQETSQTVAKVAVLAYAAKKLIDTASQIAIVAARAKL
jgi:hypothetical protein